jgi:hypothetical protein
MSELGEVNKYSNASIYTIRCRSDDSLIYVGSTISPIHKRLSCHKDNCKNGRAGSLYSYIIDNDWSDWYLELYERFPCNDRAELCKREGEVIREIGTINKQIAGRTAKESVRNWQANNRDKYLENMRNWYENNRDKHLENMRNWYENNRDKHLDNCKKYKTRKCSLTP